MKTLNKGHNNKWLLTAALLAALGLNSGLWGMKQETIKSADFSAEVTPTELVAPLAAKNTAISARDEAEKVYKESERAWETEKTRQGATVASIKAAREIADAKKATFERLGAEATKAIAAYDEAFKKQQAAAALLASNTAGTVPGIPGLQCTDCAAAKRAIDQQIADAVRAQLKTKEAEKSTEDEEKERVKGLFKGIVKNCSDTKEYKMLKCLTDGLIEVLDNNKGEKKLKKEMVVEFYKDQIEPQLKTDMRVQDSVQFTNAIQSISRFEGKLPSDYNYLREMAVDSGKSAVLQIAIDAQEALKASDLAKDPYSKTRLLQRGSYYQQMFNRDTSYLDKGYETGLRYARGKGLVSDSLIEQILEQRWRDSIDPVYSGFNLKPKTYVIQDDGDLELVRRTRIGATALRTQQASARRIGRNSSTRAGTKVVIGGIQAKAGTAVELIESDGGEDVILREAGVRTTRSGRSGRAK